MFFSRLLKGVHHIIFVSNIFPNSHLIQKFIQFISCFKTRLIANSRVDLKFRILKQCRPDSPDKSCHVSFGTWLRGAKKAFIYYARVFWGFLEPPTPYVTTFSVHKTKENLQISEPPTHPYNLTFSFRVLTSLRIVSICIILNLNKFRRV